MSELDSDSPPPVSESSPKKKKEKKRPSDFEIVRTILQRTHERKLPYLYKDMGEDSDILFFCSARESEFTYGSSETGIAIFEFTDPELKQAVETCLNKLHGMTNAQRQQRIINVRDQISELAKTKGESIDTTVETNAYGSAWCVRTDVRGQERTVPYVTAIESLFHMQLVADWCKRYRPLLATDSPDHLYYPYQHPEGGTASMLTLPPLAQTNHPLTALYPHGYRALVTRGLDVILNKFIADIPYPIEREEILIFQDDSSCCQMAHRIIAQGWRMVLLRPHAYIFPALQTILPTTGTHTL